MITLRQGNIFTSQLPTIANPVNCVGVMGAGLAKEFAKRFPTYFDWYKDQCKKGLWFPGEIHYYHRPNSAGNGSDPKTILSVVTKSHWKNPSRLDYIRKALNTFVQEHKVKSLLFSGVAFPALGCGLGGLREADVIPLMSSYLANLPSMEFEIWTPSQLR